MEKSIGLSSGSATHNPGSARKTPESLIRAMSYTLFDKICTEKPTFTDVMQRFSRETVDVMDTLLAMPNFHSHINKTYPYPKNIIILNKARKYSSNSWQQPYPPDSPRPDYSRPTRASSVGEEKRETRIGVSRPAEPFIAKNNFDVDTISEASLVSSDAFRAQLKTNMHLAADLESIASSEEDAVQLCDLRDMSSAEIHAIFQNYEWRTSREENPGKGHFAQWLKDPRQGIPERGSRMNCWEGLTVALVQLDFVSKEDIQHACGMRLGLNPEHHHFTRELNADLCDFLGGSRGDAKLILADSSQAHSDDHVFQNELVEGDIIFFGYIDDHVGLYIGDGKVLSLYMHPRNGMVITSIQEILDTAQHNGSPLFDRDTFHVSRKFRRESRSESH